MKKLLYIFPLLLLTGCIAFYGQQISTEFEETCIKGQIKDEQVDMLNRDFGYNISHKDRLLNSQCFDRWFWTDCFLGAITQEQADRLNAIRDINAEAGDITFSKVCSEFVEESLLRFFKGEIDA